MAKKPRIYTIGHSTHPIEEFIELLQSFDVEHLVDVRTIPKSRHNPQFHIDSLVQTIPEAGITYSHIEELGGLRRTSKDSPNKGWRNASFRGYADHMASKEFEAGLKKLMKIARKQTTAIMCSEAVPWRCHRSLIGDALIKEGFLVNDIMSKTKASPHRLTSFLKMRKGQITYPEE